MKKYIVNIDPEALIDIQEITDWYNEQQTGLGKRFQRTLTEQIDSLEKSPQIYAIRYNEIRCMIVKRFPHLVHFHIDEKSKTVEVLAVIHTNRNPKIWNEKTNRNT